MADEINKNVKFQLTAEDRTRGAFADVKRNLGGVSQEIDRFKAAFGAALGVVGVGALLRVGKEAIDAAGGLGELAEQLGTTTDEFQGYQFGAGQVGVKNAELETGFAKLTRSIGEAVRGDRIAIEAFQALGVGLLDAQGKVVGTDAAIRLVADGLAAIPDPARRASLAADLFGRAGQRLLPLLSGGAAGLDKFKREAADAGAILDEKLIANADKASDALVRLNSQYDKFIQSRAATNAPIYEFFAKLGENALKFLNSSETGTVFEEIERLKSLNLDVPVPKDGSLKKYLDDLREAKALREAAFGADTAPFVGGSGLSLDRPLDERKKIEQTVLSLHNEIEALQGTRREREINAALQKAGISAGEAEADVIVQLVDRLHDEKTAREALNESLKIATDQANEEQRAREQASERAQKTIADRERLAAGFDREISENERLIAALKKSTKEYEIEAAHIQILNQYRAAGIPLIGEEIDQARVLAESLGKQREQLNDLRDAHEANKTAARDAFSVIGRAAEDAAVKGGNLRDVLKGVEEDLARIAYRRLVTKPLENAFGKIADGIDFGDILGSGGNFLTNLFNPGGDESQFAEGGPVGGGPIVVGEEGPEIFEPGGSGFITPNHALGGSGDTYIFKNSFDARGAAPGMEAKFRAMLAESERRTIAAVAGLADRGGGYAKSVGRRR